MLEIIYKLFLCHFIGDYVLQTDYLAKTKGENWWHMIAHCMAYTTAFIFCFGFGWEILLLFLSHLIIDSLKVRANKKEGNTKGINYIADQLLHISFLLFVLAPMYIF